MRVRYRIEPKIEFKTLQQEIWNLFIATDGFYFDPFEVEFSETTSTPEEYLSDPTITSGEDDYSTPEGTENSFEEEPEELIPNFLFAQQPLNQPQIQQPNPMAQPQQANFQNLTAALAALQNALPNTNQALLNNTNAINNPPRREGRVADLPYFFGGDQDPISWLKDFTNACNANGINDN